MSKRRRSISTTRRGGGERSIHQQALHLTAERKELRVQRRRPVLLAQSVIAKSELAVCIRTQSVLTGARGNERLQFGEVRKCFLTAIGTLLGEDHACPTGHPHPVASCLATHRVHRRAEAGARIVELAVIVVQQPGQYPQIAARL